MTPSERIARIREIVAQDEPFDEDTLRELAPFFARHRRPWSPVRRIDELVDGLVGRMRRVQRQVRQLNAEDEAA